MRFPDSSVFFSEIIQRLGPSRIRGTELIMGWFLFERLEVFTLIGSVSSQQGNNAILGRKNHEETKALIQMDCVGKLHLDTQPGRKGVDPASAELVTAQPIYTLPLSGSSLFPPGWSCGPF